MYIQYISKNSLTTILQDAKFLDKGDKVTTWEFRDNENMLVLTIDKEEE